MSMVIYVNGREDHVNEKITLDMLIDEKKINKEHIIVEVNGIIIENEKYAVTVLHALDKLEIIHYMGGG